MIRRNIWPLEIIGRLCDPVQGVDPRVRYGAGTFRYVDISSVDNRRKIITGAREIQLPEAPSRARQLISGQDVLVSTVRPNLNAVALVPDELDGQMCSTGFCVLRARRELLDPEYLFGWVQHPEFVGRLVRQERGIGYPAVSDGDVKSILIPLPPLPEQRCIAEILHRADDLHQLRHRANERAKDLLPALFYEAFLRDESRVHGWGTVQLGQRAPFVTSGSRGWAKYYSNTGGKFIRVQNVGEGGLLLDDLAYVQPPQGSDRDRALILPGDLLITITGTVGRVAVAPPDLGEAYVSQHVAIVRLDGSLSPLFVASYLNHPLGGRRGIERQNYGQIKPGLNLLQIQSLMIPTPPDTLVKWFEDITAQISALAFDGQASGLRFQALSGSLLARAFTGELTAAWREAHKEELAQAAAERGRLLAREHKPIVQQLELRIDEKGLTQALASLHLFLQEMADASRSALVTLGRQALPDFAGLADSLHLPLQQWAEEINASITQQLAALSSDILAESAKALASIADLSRSQMQAYYADLAEKLAELARLALDEPLTRQEVQKVVLATAADLPLFFTLYDLAHDWRLNHLPRYLLREAVDVLVVLGRIRPAMVKLETDDPQRPYDQVAAYALVREEDLVASEEMML